MTTRFYPYPTLFGDVKLTVDAVNVDGHQPRQDIIRSDERVVDLSGIEEARAGWRRVQLAVRVQADEEEIEGMRNEGRAINASLVASGGPTNMRQTTLLAVSPLSPAIWQVDIELDRQCFVGKAMIRALIAAEVEGRPHRLMGSSAPWSIYFQTPPPPVVHGMIAVRWADFRTEEKLRPYDGEPFFADLEDDPPVLYLNKGIPGLPELLSDERKQNPAERALRDSERMGMARSVWMGLFNAALPAVDEPMEGLDPTMPDRWRGEVLKHLLPRIYPNMSEPESLRAALSAQTEVQSAAALQSVVQTAVSRQIKAAAALRTSLRELERLT